MKDRKKLQHNLRERHLRRDRQRRINLLIEKGMIESEKEIPEDSIPVDPNRSTTVYGLSPWFYYIDEPFVCSDCGSREVWKAVAKQYYFEVVGASKYHRAKRCLKCRIALRARNKPKL